MKRAFYKPRLVTGIIFSLLFFYPPSIYAFEDVPIIPRCKSQESQKGFYKLQPQIRISITSGTASEDQFKAKAERFAVFLRKGAGLKVTVVGKGKAGESEIKLRVAPDNHDGFEELYRDNDPWNHTNLAAKSEYGEVLAQDRSPWGTR